MEDVRRGLLFAICALVLSTLVLSVVAAGADILPGDIWIAQQVQRTESDAGDAVAAIANGIGSFWGAVIAASIIAAIFARAGMKAEIVLVIGTVVMRGVNPMLKSLLGSPRPTDDFVVISEQAQGLGFPSGHSMGAALLYGMSAFLFARHVNHRGGRVFVWAGAIVVILIAGYGRIYTGAHWPSDVLGGYVWAACIALLLLSLAHIVGFRLSPTTEGQAHRETEPTSHPGYDRIRQPRRSPD